MYNKFEDYHIEESEEAQRNIVIGMWLTHTGV